MRCSYILIKKKKLISNKEKQIYVW